MRLLQTGVTVSKVVTVAQNTGWTAPNNGLGAVLLVLPIAMFTFYGASFGTYFAGESQGNQKNAANRDFIFHVFVSNILDSSPLSRYTAVRAKSLQSNRLRYVWIRFGIYAVANPDASTGAGFLAKPQPSAVFSAFVVINSATVVRFLLARG